MRNFISRRVALKVIFPAFLCGICFFVGMTIYPYLEIFLPGYIVEFVRTGEYHHDATQSVSSAATRNTFAVEVSQDPVIQEAHKMQEDVIVKLDHNYNALLEGNKPYLETRKKIRDEYALGKKDNITLRSFSYLNSLEGKWDDVKKADEEFCKNKELCAKATTHVTLSGIIKDDTGKPVVGAKISPYGLDAPPVLSGPDGSYSLSFDTLGPRRLRFQVIHSQHALAVHTVSVVDPLYAVSPTQNFTKDFTLRSIYQEAFIDTQKKTITGKGTSLTREGYQIVDPFTKYLIPFDTLTADGIKPYRGKVRAVIYEFDRTTANELLNSDVFTDVSGYAAQALVTYGMPIIFFYDSAGNRIEVYKKNPMQVWTTNRELSALIEANSADEKTPFFNPDDYDETQSPDNVKKLITKDELYGYTESMKDEKSYPITFEWTLTNKSRLPAFWVYDQFSGLWENVGYSLVEKTTNLPYSIHAPFWTKK